MVALPVELDGLAEVFQQELLVSFHLRHSRVVVALAMLDLPVLRGCLLGSELAVHLPELLVVEQIQLSVLSSISQLGRLLVKPKVNFTGAAYRTGAGQLYELVGGLEA